MEQKPKKYIVTDGELVLELVKEGKWYCVSCPFQPGVITQARTLEEAFEMARDAAQLLDDYHSGKPESAPTPTKTKKRTGAKKIA